ncbi:hypothetical protein Pint_31518 [Pistacia integerrima]|uniref:Uncharacterized protein n=1 Tax=Pistacia integerrima TaxID=434235 RepID=A0ACC0XQB3_9ROSI|nr:hypothetical protein Pint_31518 [Pistacia integerrima]
MVGFSMGKFGFKGFGTLGGDLVKESKSSNSQVKRTINILWLCFLFILALIMQHQGDCQVINTFEGFNVFLVCIMLSTTEGYCVADQKPARACSSLEMLFHAVGCFNGISFINTGICLVSGKFQVGLLISAFQI